jgi:hypothetical protein
MTPEERKAWSDAWEREHGSHGPKEDLLSALFGKS